MFENGKKYRTQSGKEVKLITYDQLLEMERSLGIRYGFEPRIDLLYGVYVGSPGRAEQRYDHFNMDGNPVKYDGSAFTTGTTEKYRLLEPVE